MARAYYASRISDNISKTPEGFLVCSAVPIARIGEYKYLASEIGMTGDQVVKVYRTEDEVFSPKSIASFEGKAFTNEHPNESVEPDNWAMYAKGELVNVRKGSGELKDCLVADIIIRDPNTISEVESGVKREVSAGYDCDYIEKDGKIYQSNILGNHVALVKEGRAGHDVRIRDEQTIDRKSYKNIKTLRNAEKLITSKKYVWR